MSFLKHLMALAICNSKLAAAKVFLLAISIFPGKMIFINAVTLVHSFYKAVRSRQKWPDILAFAKTLDSSTPRPLFILKFFFHQTKISTVANVYYEAPTRLKKYILTEEAVVLKEAADYGDGAIILGAHFGPLITTFALRQTDIEVRPVVSNVGFAHLESVKKYALPFLMRKKFLFIDEQMRPFFPGESERELLTYLKGGGIVSMSIDFPKVAAGGAIVNFFGKPLSFSYFPFKLSINHGVPVFFYCLAADKSGGYGLRLVRSETFSTPEAGVEAYVRFFHGVISDSPYLWTNLAEFATWAPAKTVALLPQ